LAKSAVLVTGAFGGIGRAIVENLSDAGYHVIGVDRKTGSIDKLGALVRCDLESLVGDRSLLTSFGKNVRSELNGMPLTALVNNAAVQKLGRFEEFDLDDWQSTFNCNLTVPFLLSQLFVSELCDTGGSIVNISSVHATATKPLFVSYAASKAGIEGLTRALAVELGGRVRVNAVRPAAIRTPMLEAGFSGNADGRQQLNSMHPAGRIGEPSEVADVVRFLISNCASFITGAVLNVDGGILSRLHDPE
jgi:NAD(P)-dependent dehydrogenase (short-subunit alcohol dehydrogenase family)